MEKWQAFFILEPWGYRVENRRMGVVTATIANCVAGLSDNPLKATDIFPDKPLVSTNKAPSLNSMKVLGAALKSLNGN